MWLQVGDIAVARRTATAHGGEVLGEVVPDGPDRLIAQVLDPAGNVLGLVQSRER